MAKANKKATTAGTIDNKKMLKDLIKASGSEWATIADDGGAEITGFIDTGSTSLNALISGSIRGGYPVPKITGLAGDPSTGKTFFMLEGVRSFTEENPNGIVVIYDSEHNISKALLESRGIDPTRVIVVEVDTIEDFKTRSVKMLQHYLTLDKATRPPMFMALDSLGMLSTIKETEDAAEDKHVVDMTKARVTKGTFRILTSLLGRARVPMVVTNHTYQSIGMFPTKKMGGGTGLEYAASTIIFLSKKKDKEGSGMDAVVVGNDIICTLKKSRNTIENKVISTYLSYANGLNPYAGLLDIAVGARLVKALGRKEYQFPDGVVVHESELDKNPGAYYTEELLDQIDEACGKIFKYSVKSDDIAPAPEVVAVVEDEEPLTSEGE